MVLVTRLATKFENVPSTIAHIVFSEWQYHQTICLAVRKVNTVGTYYWDQIQNLFHALRIPFQKQTNDKSHGKSAMICHDVIHTLIVPNHMLLNLTTYH